MPDSAALISATVMALAHFFGAVLSLAGVATCNDAFVPAEGAARETNDCVIVPLRHCGYETTRLERAEQSRSLLHLMIDHLTDSAQPRCQQQAYNYVRTAYNYARKA